MAERKKNVTHTKGKSSKGSYQGEFHHIQLELTPEQQAELEQLTGKKIANLRITVEDLASLSDVLLN